MWLAAGVSVGTRGRASLCRKYTSVGGLPESRTAFEGDDARAPFVVCGTNGVQDRGTFLSGLAKSTKEHYDHGDSGDDVRDLKLHGVHGGECHVHPTQRGETVAARASIPYEGAGGKSAPRPQSDAVGLI